MSLEKKSVHVRLSPEMHEKLSLLADMNNKDIAELLGEWTEKTIAGEWHVFNLIRERLMRLGTRGN